jgi:hypothetical protein
MFSSIRLKYGRKREGGALNNRKRGVKSKAKTVGVKLQINYVVDTCRGSGRYTAKHNKKMGHELLECHTVEIIQSWHQPPISYQCLARRHIVVF